MKKASSENGRYQSSYLPLGTNLCIKETAALRLFVAVVRNIPKSEGREGRMRRTVSNDRLYCSQLVGALPV
jgi:hypothetical protein